ncbi:hypothetical protein LSCM1_04106 [Leishmania martiniquensis]|uniref:Glucosidase 2 subunit beta n=1 Tax=Leishmania martiniquensis TaxID=1580590 RepID=A0A836H7F7_9TRYP|nr:hypothetical protein LSCM1_04106 [Leishmania martiniquensis]
MAATWWAFFTVTLLCVPFAPVHGHILGVQRQHTAYFHAAKEAGLFGCLDGSATILFSAVNDEVCDCADGSDEPGTSACNTLRGSTLTPLPPKWRFQCTSEDVSQEVFHSRVNDGICDCCDGSDEAGSRVSCPNRCAEVVAGLERHHKEELAKMKKAKEAKEAMRSAALLCREEAEKSLLSLEEMHTDIVVSISRLEAAGVTAAEEEASETEWVAEQGEWEGDHFESESKDRASSCIGWRDTKLCDSGDVDNSDSSVPCNFIIMGDSAGYCECGNKEEDEHEEAYGAGTAPKVEDEGVETRKGTVTYHFPCGHPELRCDYVCDHKGEAGVPEERDVTQNPDAMLKEAAEALRDQKRQLKDIEKKINDTKKLLSPNITKEDLLRTLKWKEFKLHFRGYTYTISLFGDVYQVDSAGESVLLGSWKSFAENTYSMWSQDAYDYSHLIYEEGSMCWNSQARKVQVHLVCGPENELISVEEPSLCNYYMTFQTPAVCDD